MATTGSTAPARTRRTASPRTLPASMLRHAPDHPGDPGAAAPTVTVRVATYRRASTDEENQPYSLEVQATKLAAYIESQDGMVLVADYEERASAKDIEGRSQLLRLLEDAAAGTFDQVLVYKVDRWSRRLADLLATLEFLDRHQVMFASATEPIDTTTNLGKLVLQMLGSFAEFERGLIVERVTRGIEAKLDKGLPLTSLVGFGLRVDADGKVEKDPATFGVVERIFAEYTSQHLGVRAIATGLNHDGLPTPGSRPWSGASVARVLRSRTFVGDLPFRDGWVDGAHEPLLDVAVFDKAQQLADRRSKPAAAARSKGDFLLSGVIVCGHCHGHYLGTTGTSANKTKVRYYSCATARKYGRKHCPGPSIPADDLETLVTETLLATYADSDLFEAAVTAHLASRETRVGPLTAELAAAQGAAADKERLLSKYRDDYEADRIRGDVYQDRKDQLDEELLNVRGHIAELELAIAAAGTEVAPTEEDRATLHGLLATGVRTGSVPVRKALFTALVEKLEVHDLDDIQPTFRIGGPDLAGDAASSPGGYRTTSGRPGSRNERVAVR